ASAEACFAVLSADQRQAVKAIAMDMSAAFVKATRETFPLADT
ncbi:MAG TPA: ISL3 family transposase, partial [Planctomycetaceae bacterium]|nr:ISL3 family transposase [Planctomycetaceae bacterium]